MPAIPIKWPDDKDFAFTIIDDTDCATVETTKPIYDLLEEYGFRTTKTVWPLSPVTRPITGGESLEDLRYLKWILKLQQSGFEIALHGVADGSSLRDRVIEGLSRYRDILGENPRVHINHVGQREGIYWGAARFDEPVRSLYQAYRRHLRGSEIDSRGHLPDSRFFWGDCCRESPTFVRNLVFQDVNTLKMDPLMPYHDPARPYVRNWFSGSNGAGVNAFCKLISEENQDRLVRERGACIVYTHLGSTFYPVRPDFKRLLRKLADRNGWFVPVSTLMEHLGEQRGWINSSNYRRSHQVMQLRWFCQQALSGAPALSKDAWFKTARLELEKLVGRFLDKPFDKAREGLEESFSGPTT
jgi:hypothetical protein